MLQFGQITRLGGVVIKHQDDSVPAPLLAVLAIPFVRKKMFQRGQQERAESALLRADGSKIITPQQPGEELLCQVLGFDRAMAFASDERVEWKPILATKPLQGLR